MCNDASTDESLSLLHIWQEKFNAVGIQFKIYSNESGVPGGGKGRNNHGSDLTIIFSWVCKKSSCQLKLWRIPMFSGHCKLNKYCYIIKNDVVLNEFYFGSLSRIALYI